MLKAILSPSKKLDFDRAKKLQGFVQSSPALSKETDVLLREMKRKSKQDIAKLMSLSDKLAELNYDRYQRFLLSDEARKNSSNQALAIAAFQGDVYEGLDFSSLSNMDKTYCNEKILILSGLYGVLSPFDMMQPYRLEMGTKLEISYNGKDIHNLYDFWGNKITDFINSQSFDILVNLASHEYFKSVNAKKLNKKLIDIDFKEDKNGKISTIGLYAKKARGLMARYIVENKIEKDKDLMKFDILGYKLAENMSTEQKYVFVRKH